MVTRYEGCDVSDAQDCEKDNIPYVLTSAGCHRFKNEDNDCAIVALAIATDLPYGLIHKLAEVCLGRKRKEPTLNMIYACQFYPFKFRKVNKKRHRLNTIVDLFPKGRYYVQIGGRNRQGKISCHALALVDGKIYDRHIESPDRWVTGVWKIEGLKSDRWIGWKKRSAWAHYMQEKSNRRRINWANP
jgi:hypothetical protein